MKKNIKVLSIILVLAMILPGIVQAAPTTVEDVKDIHIKRIAGETRIHTAVNVSGLAYKEGVDTVVLAGFAGEADALTGTLLAAHNNAPLLLTHKTRVSEGLKPELLRLNPKNIIILGGTAAISKGVEDELKENYNVKRVAGDNRAETAVKVADEVVKGNADHIFLALGYNDQLADALAIGPVSAKKNSPILLTQTKRILPETEQAIEDLSVKEITIVGGHAAVSKEVETELKELGLKVNRIDGARREETALKVANKYFPESKNSIVASGWNYSDALVGGYLGELLEMPILLTNNKILSPITNEYIKANSQYSYVLGGETIITSSVFEDIKLANQMTENTKYIGNINTKVFHGMVCRAHPDEVNRGFFDNKEDAINAGYRACKICKP